VKVAKRGGNTTLRKNRDEHITISGSEERYTVYEPSSIYKQVIIDSSRGKSEIKLADAND
jgi:hypothetical protein